MTKDKTNVISINGTEHDVNSMSDEQKHIINQIKSAKLKPTV